MEFEEGNKVFLRSVTHYYLGEVVKITPEYIKLKRASWVADTRRFGDFLSKGVSEQAEIEPYPDPEGVIVYRSALVDGNLWKHDLPTEQQ